MACRKHNYKGRKPCEVCQGERNKALFWFVCIALLLFWIL